MSVPAPSPILVAFLSGSMAGVLFLLPRLSAAAPVLSLPLNLAGLFSAVPLLAVRIRGSLVHAVLAALTAVMLISLVESTETALGFGVLFGLWALVAGEVLSRRKSMISGAIAGFRFARGVGEFETPSRIEAFLRSREGDREGRKTRDLGTLRNELERSAVEESPALKAAARRVRKIGRSAGALHAAMSGSGSSFFLLFEREESRQAASLAFHEASTKSIPCGFLSRLAYERRFEIKSAK